jgi:hypothetical protein
MAQKTVKTRIRQKHELAANWESATNFKPLAGELIVYDAEGEQGPRLKIGDESTPVNELPFVEAIPLAHEHSISDITDFPTSLPADGGNADTVDGKHANEFAPADHGTHVTTTTVKTALGATGANTSTKYLREDGT